MRELKGHWVWWESGEDPVFTRGHWMGEDNMFDFLGLGEGSFTIVQSRDVDRLAVAEWLDRVEREGCGKLDIEWCWGTLDAIAVRMGALRELRRELGMEG